jgi:cobalt/nickel transport system ATP-binding protein
MSHLHIDIENLSFSYDENIEILKNIDLRFNEHDSIGIIGANGTGKSTLLKLLVGLEPITTGEIRVNDIPITKDTIETIRERIAYVFQDSDSQLFMTNVYDDVAFLARNYKLPETKVNELVLNTLEKINILHLKDRQIYKLSGGEKKLVSIATVLTLTPDIILMDEPSITLDPKNRRNLINLLNKFDHLKVIASHDLDMIMDTCQRVILINNGVIIKDGSVEEILYDKKILEENGLELPFCLQKN